jgi:hypothetical protein
MSILKKILEAGTDEKNRKMSVIEKRIIRFSNFFNLFFILISITMVILINLYFIEGFKSYIRYLLLIPFCILNILLNRFHFNITARILTALAPFFFIFVFPFLNHFIYSGMFISFPFGIMIIGTVSFFIFSYDNEKFLLNTSILFFITSSIFYDKILFYSSPDNMDLSFIYGDNHIYFQISKIILVCFLYTSLYTAKIVSYKFRTIMIEFNSILDHKNTELNSLNQNLERTVKERTEKVSLQNKRIKDLAFTNSHIVRASVARIIGLINIVNGYVSEEDKEFCYKMIRESALELDLETDKIAQNLKEEN